MRSSVRRAVVAAGALAMVLAAGVLAARTVLTIAGAASASVSAARPGSWRGVSAARHTSASCIDLGDSDVRYVSAKNVSYYLGTPDKLSSGAAAILKPSLNNTTLWNGCEFTHGQFLLTSKNQGLALTSRSSGPGEDVTVETPGNSGNGFASQHWTLAFPTGNTLTLQNVKTGLYLRIRNSGPSMYQTVTHRQLGHDLEAALGDGRSFRGLSPGPRIEVRGAGHPSASPGT